MKAHLWAALTLSVLSLLVVGCGKPVGTDPDSGTDADAGADGGNPDSGTPAADTDVAVIQLNADGTLDTAFGASGTKRLDLSTGAARDTVYAIAKDGQDRVVLFGTARGEGDRADADRVVVRLTATGALDTSFATGGVYRLNIDDLQDNQRGGVVQSDGKIVTAGYVNKRTGVGAQTANHVVLARLNSDGTPDSAFGQNGVVIDNPFSSTSGEWGMAEAYAVGQQSSGKYVTVGYGRQAPTGTVDVVSFRYSATGALDNSYASSGVAVFDHVGADDRGRYLAVLPDNRVFVVGSGITTTGNINALAMLLKDDGTLDDKFSSDGKELYDFGRADDAFFGATASSNHLVAVGFSAGKAVGTGANADEDSAIFIHPLTGGATIAKTIALSESENDRLWSATFDGAGRIVAAGFIDEGGDTRMAVARFNLDGTLDSSFGTGGIVKVNAQQAGKVETARSVVVLSNGKIVVAGNVEHQE